jgi:ribosomal protein S12 methylthiotransferase accessory factor
VIVQDYLQEELEQINQKARREKRSWMLVKATGSTVWWGPLFTPDGTGCWSCLAQRLRRNRWSKALSRMAGTAIVRNGRSDLALGGLPEAGFKLAALSLFQWVTNPDYHDLEDRVYSLNGQSLVLSHHRFSRLEHCPVCGNTEKKVPGNPGLPAGELQAEVDGRSCSTEQTFERLRHHISPVTGICGSLEPLFESDSIPIYVYEAGRPFGLRGKPAWFPGSSSIFWATGRGASRLEARTGALCESIERHAGTFRGCEPTVVSTFRELGPAAVDPNSIMNFSARQYSERELSREIPNTWIPEPLDEGCAIEWTPVWSLTEGTVKYVPTALCYYGYEGAGTRFCKADSNGCAAGNTAEEAIAHGLLELVERDAAAIWWYNQISRAGVDLDSLDDPWISRVDGYHDGLGRELEVLEITSDLQIPTFVSISRARSGSLSDLILGFGSSLSPLSAIKRSILEMHQLLPLILAGGSTQRETGLTESMQANDSWLRPSDRRSLKSAADLGIPSRRIPATSGRRGGPDLEVCLDLARKQGLEVLVLDHTSREVDLAVVRVFVPTLRPWWARFGPGRLYDVPVKMKWRSGPCAEENLNKANLIF